VSLVEEAAVRTILANLTSSQPDIAWIHPVRQFSGVNGHLF